MVNYQLMHNMPGLEKNLFVCSCGHQEYIEKKEEMIVCPNCNTEFQFYVAEFDKLNFNEEEFKIDIIQGYKNSDLLYDFHIDIMLLKNSYIMDFNNKKMILLNEKSKDYKIFQFRINFNGNLYNQSMIKITNLITNEEYTEEMYFDELEKFKKDFQFEYLSQYHIKNTIRRLDIPELKSFRSKFCFASFNIFKISHALFETLRDLEKKCTQFEKLIKVGIDPLELSGKFSSEGASIKDMLKLSPYSINIVKEKGANYVNKLQIIENTFKEQAINYIKLFGYENDFSEHDSIRIGELVNESNFSLKKLYNFINHKAPLKQGLYDKNETLTLLYDSFSMSRDLELPFNNYDTLVRYHNTLMKEYSMLKNKIKDNDFIKAVKEYSHFEYKPDTIKVVENDKVVEKKTEFFMTVPKDIHDLIKEGKTLKHCVGSYVDRIIKRHSIILFLRNKKDPDASYCTIEVSAFNRSIMQLETKTSKTLNNKKAAEFLNAWCEKFYVKNF